MMAKKVIKNISNYQPKISIIHSKCINIHRWNEIFPSGLTILPQRAKGHLTKTPTPGMKTPLYSCWSESSEGFSKHCRLLPLAAPKRQKVKSTLQKTPCTSDTGPKSLWAEMTWMPPPWGLALMVPESHVSFQRREATTSPPQRWHLCTTPESSMHDNPQCAVCSRAHLGNQQLSS